MEIHHKIARQEVVDLVIFSNPATIWPFSPHTCIRSRIIIGLIDKNCIFVECKTKNLNYESRSNR